MSDTQRIWRRGGRDLIQRILEIGGLMSDTQKLRQGDSREIIQRILEVGGQRYVDKLIETREGLAGCVRCQGTHETLDWHLLTNPSLAHTEHEQPMALVAWAICPTTNEPILQWVGATWQQILKGGERSGS